MASKLYFGTHGKFKGKFRKKANLERLIKLTEARKRKWAELKSGDATASSEVNIKLKLREISYITLKYLICTHRDNAKQRWQFESSVGLLSIPTVI